MKNPVYEFLKDLDELKWFWTYAMRPLKQNEVFFISTSARNKRLDGEERAFFQVGRSEMWHKEIITEDDFSRFLRGVRRCEANKLAYLTQNGMPYPAGVLVLYVNIAPADAYAALFAQMDHLLAAQRELADSLLKNSPEGIRQAFHAIRHSHTTGQSVFARSFSDGEWLDIDSDIEHFETAGGRAALRNIRDFLCEETGRGNYMQIQTTGGFHWLIRQSTLAGIGRKYKTDPAGIIVSRMNAECKAAGITINEIIKNKNRMIPLPGTVQYGRHVVTVLNKEDFSEDKKLHAWPDYREYQEE
ncbi:MAG: hypothetical protein LBC88_08170 [Spirochaetaceae bacterium]|jgi:hypothetical protein|nr:hypothetical protein [Spirochaetaceae bacterium]